MVRVYFRHPTSQAVRRGIGVVPEADAGDLAEKDPSQTVLSPAGSPAPGEKDAKTTAQSPRPRR